MGREYRCHSCNAPITFTTTRTSLKALPLNMDGSKHYCTERQATDNETAEIYYLKMSVAQLNLRLRHHKVRLVVEPVPESKAAIASL